LISGAVVSGDTGNCHYGTAQKDKNGTFAISPLFPLLSDRECENLTPTFSNNHITVIKVNKKN